MCAYASVETLNPHSCTVWRRALDLYTRHTSSINSELLRRFSFPTVTGTSIYFPTVIKNIHKPSYPPCQCVFNGEIVIITPKHRRLRRTQNKVLTSISSTTHTKYVFVLSTSPNMVDEKCVEVAHSVDVYSDPKSVPTVSRYEETTRRRYVASCSHGK